MIGFSLLVLAARGPVFNNKKWVGWGKKGEWALVKPKVKKVVDQDQEMGLRTPTSKEEKIVQETPKAGVDGGTTNSTAPRTEGR